MIGSAGLRTIHSQKMEVSDRMGNVPNQRGGVPGRGPAPTEPPPATTPPSWADIKADNDRLREDVARLEAEVERWKLMHIEAMNPGIDMERVKAERARQGRDQGAVVEDANGTDDGGP